MVRSNPMHPLYCDVPVLCTDRTVPVQVITRTSRWPWLHAVLLSLISILMLHIAAELHSRAGLFIPLSISLE